MPGQLEAMRRAFAETASGYDQYSRRYFSEIARWLVAATRIERSDRVLDVACGSGLISRALTELELGEPVGLDYSEALLELAPMQAMLAGDACSLPLRDGAFDAVVCNLGLQMIGEYDFALSEMARVARPGAKIGISIWGEQDSDTGAVMGEVVLDMVEALPEYNPKDWQASVSRIDSEDELAAAISDAGLIDVEVRTESITSKFEGAGELFDSFAVFPRFRRRLNALGARASEARQAAIEAQTKETGSGPIETVDFVLIATARR